MELHVKPRESIKDRLLKRDRAALLPRESDEVSPSRLPFIGVQRGDCGN